MSPDDTSDDPLERYDELVMEGRAPEPAAFAARYPDHPDLLQRIHALERLRSQLDALADTVRAPQESWPERLGDFELQAPLGRGGMGVVFRARRRGSEHVCALKLVRYTSSVARERLRREAALAARLDHPGIARVEAFGSEAGHVYLATELVVGASLRTVLDGEAPRAVLRAFPADIAGRVGIALQIAEALAYAHAAGVVHRDVKPSNVMLQQDGTTKLIDFGLALAARGVHRPPRLTRTGVFVGTHNYAAPEQLRGAKEQVGPWSDTYALGATLYELLTGRPPFQCATPVARQAVAHAAPPQRARELRSDIPRGVDKLLQRALHPKAKKRFTDGAALADALRQCLHTLDRGR